MALKRDTRLPRRWLAFFRRSVPHSRFSFKGDGKPRHLPVSLSLSSSETAMGLERATAADPQPRLDPVDIDDGFGI